ncbi:MAG: disulfide bond formation protein B [Rhodobiaceae bacterium]|nr:disulfide bond formation protein B [Rhodobiaceae bacterium]
MSLLTKLPIANRQVPWLIFGISVVTLCAALAFEHIGGLAPCSLCLQQRYAYYLLIPVSLIAGILSRETNLGLAPVVLIVLCTFAAAANVVLAGYHAGVEYKWWEGPQGCTGVNLMAGSLDEFRQQLDGVTVPRCDEVPWSLFGISMAGYNFLISILLTALGSIALARYWTMTGLEEE